MTTKQPLAMTADAKTVRTLGAVWHKYRVSNAEDAALMDTPPCIDKNSPDVLINKGL
jgi:hypothetical protein